MPIYGYPGGYGMLQLDPPMLPTDIWDWRGNISSWQTRFREIAGPERDTRAESSDPNWDKRAYPFWIRQVLQWQEYNANQILQGGQPVSWPGDPGPNISSSCIFQAPQATGFPTRNTGQPNTYWYGDAILMKQVGGAPQNYVSWIEGSQPRWSFHKENSINCDVVYEFCTCTSPNPNNCVHVPKTECGLP